MENGAKRMIGAVVVFTPSKPLPDVVEPDVGRLERALKRR
jgi:hypothetical protein